MHTGPVSLATRALPSSAAGADGVGQGDQHATRPFDHTRTRAFEGSRPGLLRSRLHDHLTPGVASHPRTGRRLGPYIHTEDHDGDASGHGPRAIRLRRSRPAGEVQRFMRRRACLTLTRPFLEERRGTLRFRDAAAW